MPSDKMYMIRNLESFQPDAEIMSVEYEVTTDSNIVGQFKYGPYSFLLWDFGTFNEGEERKLCLNIKSNVSTDSKLSATSRKAYYHGRSIADEIVSLIVILEKKIQARYGRTER